jgi:hypothetical protein
MVLVHLLTVLKNVPKKRIIQNLWSTYQPTPVVKLFHFVTFSTVTYLRTSMPDIVNTVIGDSTVRNTLNKIPQALVVHGTSLGMLCMKVFSMFSQWQSVCHVQLLKGLRIAYFLRGVIYKTFNINFGD